MSTLEPQWLDSGPGIARKRILTLQLRSSSWNLPIFVLPAVWLFVAGLSLEFPRTSLRFAGFLVIGGAIAAMDVVMHEAAHGHLYRNPTLNRWIGFLFGAPGLISVTAYRVFHLRHHAQSLTVASSEGLLNGTPAYLLGVPWHALRNANRRARNRILVEYGLLMLGAALVVISATAFGFAERIVDLWLIPLMVAIVITSIRGWTETVAAQLVRKDRASLHQWLQPLYGLTCDHLEHHLFPGVAWGKLPLLRAELKHQYALRGHGMSYLDFLWQEVEARTASTGRRKRRTSESTSA